MNYAILDRDEQRAKMARALGLKTLPRISPPGVEDGVVLDSGTLVTDIDFALKNRRDILASRKQLQVANLDQEITENNMLPSVTLSGNYAHRNQVEHASRAFSRNLTTGLYPESRIDFRIEMPLSNPGLEAEERNARLMIKTMQLKIRQLEQQVRDELELGRRRIKISQDALNAARTAQKESGLFYNSLLRDYSRGKSSAVAIKNALDAVIDAGNTYTREIINLNISKTRYLVYRGDLLKQMNVEF